MLIDLLIGFLGGHAIVGGGLFFENISKQISNLEKQQRYDREREADKMDIDPVTGDYTSRKDGLRHYEDGCVNWRYEAKRYKEKYGD